MKMLRFSCFHSHVHSHKPKKTMQVWGEAMSKSLQDFSGTQAVKDFTQSVEMTPSQLKETKYDLSNGDDHVPSPSSVEHDWKSEEVISKIGMKSDDGVQHMGNMKKCLSLGSGLDRKETTSSNHELEDESSGSQSQIGLVVPVGGKHPGLSLSDQYQECFPSDSVQLSSNMVNNGSLFSIGDPQQSEKEDCENSEAQLSGECAGESDSHTPRTPPSIVRSSSLPNFSSCCGGSSPAKLVQYSRSSEDLKVLDVARKGISIDYAGSQVIKDQERDDALLNAEKGNGEYPGDDTYDAYNYVDSPKDWIMPVMDEVNKGKNILEDSSGQWKDLPMGDFKINRIQKWVMDLQHCSALEETNEVSASSDQMESGDTVLDGLTASKVEAKVSPAMEAAKKYMASLSASATTAQLANHGLVVVPFFSSFASLKALNLSGNAIVRITAGALPRGLHILNLSKNSISTIEGLRELTRLRVLDLSYNRILRIGHGLASCSSLKELYLAGNKISEVEGLHRLLKLNVLDLRFNKLSTTKSLGQLAANYISLQAISLEGNPAQKNLGDEQLKKYLQGLLPHLAYFNRQSIKSGAVKDAADRSARLGISAHQKISESKTVRKASHGVSSSHKITSSSTHGRKSQAAVATKTSRGGRHARLPPSGIKATTDRQILHDFSSKLSFKPELSIRRSRSEGTLGVI